MVPEKKIDAKEEQAIKSRNGEGDKEKESMWIMERDILRKSTRFDRFRALDYPLYQLFHLFKPYISESGSFLTCPLRF